MNFYIYVTCREGKGNFLAATVNERRAITAVVIGLKETYKPLGFEGANVYENYAITNNPPIHVFRF